MYRFCSHCDVALDDQPALEGVNGMLCFPCRYHFDEAGGQHYLAEMEKYQPIRAHWESTYGKQWMHFQKRQGLVDKLDVACGIAGVGAFFSFVGFKATGLAVILAIGAASSWLASRVMRIAADRLRCEPPPPPPHRDQHALCAKPQLFFDAFHPRVGLPNFDTFDGYPPDWSERQEFVLERDGHCCRLCCSTENLHVHHVWPISFSSNHTPQNLITLCRSCHMKQRYWEHDRLVTENIKAKRKYFVRTYTRSDGTIVEGHNRKFGRRGNFEV